MSFAKKIFTVAAPVALLALSACTTGFPAQVSRFEAMPPPQGQSFVIEPANDAERGGLEFGQYADLVRRHLTARGYVEASSADAATLIVSLDYGVDNGRTQIVSYPSSFGGYGYYGGWGGPYYSRFRYGRSPFYYGWHDPFWYGGYDDIRSYTVFTSYLELDIRRSDDGQAVFEGSAKARSQTDALPKLVPNLVEAMFTNFPVRSGETIRITVPPPPREGS